MTDAESTNMSYCRECGERIKENAEMCPECGVRQKSPPNSREKSTGVAVVASFLFVGLGQIYNGQVLKGVGLIFLQFFNIAVLYVAFFFVIAAGLWGVAVLSIWGLFMTAVWVYGMYDAHRVAKRINAGDLA